MISSGDTSRDPSDAVTVRRLRQVMAMATGVLVAVTWPLWAPGGEFPEIPWSRLFDALVPEVFDWASLAALGALLVLQFMKLPENRTWPAALQAALFCMALMLLTADQHRLQPWVWQMVVAGVIIGVSSSSRVMLPCLRVFTASIYFWSGVSKVDWAFLTGQGQWMLDGLAGAVGLSPAWWTDNVRFTLAGVFPAWELITAFTLLWPRTRRFGLGMALVVHAALLGALGPLGQQQLPGVLMWNVYFIVQNLLLFGSPRRATPTKTVCASEGQTKAPGFPRLRAVAGAACGFARRVRAATVSCVLRNGMRDSGPPESARTESFTAPDLRAWMARLVTVGVCVLPGLSPWGYWDHWPSWAVYSSRPCVVDMSVRSDDVPRLPRSLRQFVGPAEPFSDWHPVNLDAWSFAMCRCPMYPQKRFRLAVISSLSVEHQIAPRVIVKSAPNRWTGQRSVKEILLPHGNDREQSLGDAEGVSLNSDASRSRTGFRTTLRVAGSDQREGPVVTRVRPWKHKRRGGKHDH